jgi:anti-sigma factor RsiW
MTAQANQGREEAFEARLTDLVDGTLPPELQAELEAKLADDTEAAEALRGAREAQAILGRLDAPEVPRDFLRKVQRRVRRRSGGRYFHPVKDVMVFPISVEVFVVIAICVMAAIWFLLEPGVDPAVRGDLQEIPQPGVEAER